MKHNVMLRVTSLVSVILFTLHWADEVARGLEPGTNAAIGGFLILAVWLSASLVFDESRFGLVLVLLASLLASAVPVLHMQGRGLVLGRYANTGAMLFWVWTNIALGASGMLSVVLSVRALWRLRSGRPASLPTRA